MFKVQTIFLILGSLITGLSGISTLALPASAQTTPSKPMQGMMDQATITAIAGEISGVRAKRALDQITQYHRMRASVEYRKAADFILQQLKDYGFEDAQILEYKADGKTMYGTQKSRPAWIPEFAELWEIKADGTRVRRLASYDAEPVSLAQDSDSGSATTTLVDVGSGTSEADYKGKDIKGKLVLTSSQPGTVVSDLAVKKYGAAGIISYAPNQKSAWWKEDTSLVRWGHIGSFRNYDAFSFMISLGEGRKLKARLAGGETIHFDAKVEANRTTGKYAVIMATIPGSDPVLREQEISLTCHLDHQRPGANDNASGCVSILEVARSLKKLTAEGKLPAPKRTIRFIWPAEIETSIIFLSENPDIAKHIKTNIHMDMVGGGPITKARFRVSRGPLSVPSVAGDVAQVITNYVNSQSQAFADGATVDIPLVAPSGGKEPLAALMEDLSMGSDHDVFAEGSWAIPIIYLHDWPDRYIHTNKDVAGNIDPTKLKRSSFIGAASAWTLANLDETKADTMLAIMKAHSLARAAYDLSRGVTQSYFPRDFEKQKLANLKTFMDLTDQQDSKHMAFTLHGPLSSFDTREACPDCDVGAVYRRTLDPIGPMTGFGYGYFADKIGKKAASMGIFSQPNGGARSYEVLNFVNGERSVGNIAQWIKYEFGTSNYAYVEQYLEALESIGIVEEVK